MKIYLLSLFTLIFFIDLPKCEAQKPNIIHIIADDLGWNDVSFHGSEIQTPSIDRLAKDSVILDRFYVTPICSPTRAGALTGRYPFRFGIWNGVCNPQARHGLPPSEATLPEYLEKAGYKKRALLGKWHLGLASDLFHPLNHGFSDFYGHLNGAIDYFSRKRHGQLDWHRNHEPVNEEGYSTDLIGDEAVKIIHASTSPYYLLVSFNAPHSPLQAKDKDLKKVGFKPDGPRAPNTVNGIARREKAPDYGEAGKGNSVRQTFRAMTWALDRNVGKILSALKATNTEKNTLVVFHSDNGGVPRHGGSNKPLRGNKFTTWEGGTRVVAMIRWPARIVGNGRKLKHLTCYLDLLPTFLSAAGVAVPKNLDGINLLPRLEYKVDPLDRTILLNHETVVTTRWKLKGKELFDLIQDPNESINVADKNLNIVQKLKDELSLFKKLEGPKTQTQLPKPKLWPLRDWKLPKEK